MADFEATDFFTSGSLLADPYPYYDEAHGPAGARRSEYVPTYLLRGLQRLHLEFEPVRP